MNKILQIASSSVRSDNSIARKEFHSYSSYSNRFNHNDECRITIQASDNYVLLSESYIAIEFRVSPKAGFVAVANEPHPVYTGSNFALNFFSEIRYELNNVVVDVCKNPGVVSNIKSYVTGKLDQIRMNQLSNVLSGKEVAEGTHRVLIPLYLVKYILSYIFENK